MPRAAATRQTSVPSPPSQPVDNPSACLLLKSVRILKKHVHAHLYATDDTSPDSPSAKGLGFVSLMGGPSGGESRSREGRISEGEE